MIGSPSVPPYPAPPPLRLPQRSPEGHKGTYGRVLLVGGSRGMAGSISLAAMAALRCGSGLVTVAVPDRCLETVASFDPCLMTIALPQEPIGVMATEAADVVAERLSEIDAAGCGPGIGTGDGAKAVVDVLLRQQELPRVLDADGLNVLAAGDEDWRQRVAGPIVLTPHPGEWQRLCGIAIRDREAQHRRAIEDAAVSGAVVVLKGNKTLVTDGRQMYQNPTGNPGMASGGSGDVLTGVITSLLGQGLPVYDAARLGVWVQGRAGDLAAADLGQAGMTAVDLLERLPSAIAEATEGSPNPEAGSR